MVAVAATVLGAGLGATLPFATVWIYGAKLPVPPQFRALSGAAVVGAGFRPVVGHHLRRTAACHAPAPCRRPACFVIIVEPAKAEGQTCLSRDFGGAPPSASPALTLLVAPSPRLRGGISRRRGGSAGAAAASGGRPAPRHRRPAPCRARRCSAGAGQSGTAGRGHRRRDHRPGFGATLLATVTLAERHHQRPGARRAAGARAQLFLCRYPARTKPPVSITPSPAFPAPQRLSSALP